MRTKIIILSAPILIAVAIYFSWNRFSSTTPDVIPANGVENSMAGDNAEPTAVLGMKDQAWALFQKYLDYNKKLDLAGVKSVVYKVSATCADDKATEDCKTRMSSAYAFGSILKKEDFVNVWGDDKQFILSTKYEENEDDRSIVWNRSIIFFIKGSDGAWKLLSFTPIKSIIVEKSSASRSELEDRLKIYSEDSDQDGLTDYVEQCLDSSAANTCVKTDPKSRDTNQNGWWDSVEPLLK